MNCLAQCPITKPHHDHSWGELGILVCPGVTQADYYREANRAEFVGRKATYNGRRVAIVDADDSGCAQIAFWVNRDHLEMDDG